MNARSNILLLYCTTKKPSWTWVDDSVSMVLERDLAQWLDRFALPMSMSVMRLMQDFQRNIMFLPSQYWDIVSMLCPWAMLYPPMLHLTQE